MAAPSSTSNTVRRRPGRLHDDDEDSDIRPRQLAPEAEKEEELEEPDTEPEEMEAEPAAVTITRRRVTARADNDEEDEEWRHDPMLRLLKKRGLPTRMPFGRHKGRSLREMWESEDRQQYLLQFMGRTPAFYHRANTLRNGHVYMCLLDSLSTLGCITEVTDAHGRTVRAASVLRAYHRHGRLNVLEPCGPLPRPLPERTPIRRVSAPATPLGHPATLTRAMEEEEESKEEEQGIFHTPPLPPLASKAAGRTTAPTSLGGGSAGMQTPSPQGRGGGRLPPRPPVSRPARRSLFD